jgi:hypothetical protein
MISNNFPIFSQNIESLTQNPTILNAQGKDPRGFYKCVLHLDYRRNPWGLTGSGVLIYFIRYILQSIYAPSVNTALPEDLVDENGQ